MPCFKGLAVSIHTPGDGVLPEYSIQKQNRVSRITSYVPVPPASVAPGSTTGKLEQSTFSISITLLTPGLNVPYSVAKPTPDDPYPRPHIAGGLPGSTGTRGVYGPSTQPYVPRTTSPRETVAAYIYFDGRPKEEVATLLRRGEETWVNSRWVSVPASEGGGMAERDFLFREVGLERWLNGLDLDSKDKGAKAERRRQCADKKRSKRTEEVNMDSDDELDGAKPARRMRRDGVLRYGEDKGSPLEEVANDDSFFSSNSDSDAGPPEPEAAGQIKIALFRVLASGEVKRGEYSPQFDAHDDDEAMDQNGASNGAGGAEDIDHTTSFAKPKALDPTTISTQTVTALEPNDIPYAVFTFFYRGEKQLQKMGILPSPQATEKELSNLRRKSAGTDFSKLGPLKSTGTVGFSGYRDAKAKPKSSKRKDVDAMDSDADDEDDERVAKASDDKQENGGLLSLEDARRQGELADGVQKIKLKRQHSAEPLMEGISTRKSPHFTTSESPRAGTPQSINSTSANAGTPPPESSLFPPPLQPMDAIGSPFKRHRASMPGFDDTHLFGPLESNSNKLFSEAPSATSTPAAATHDEAPSTSPAAPVQPSAKADANDDS